MFAGERRLIKKKEKIKIRVTRGKEWEVKMHKVRTRILTYSDLKQNEELPNIRGLEKP